MQKSLAFRVAVSGILPFILFFTAPASFYFDHINEIEFSLKDVFIPVLGLFIVLFCVLYLVLFLLRNQLNCFKIAAGTIVGIAAAGWVQSQLFVWEFGPLDRLDIILNKWKINMMIELIVWPLIIISIVILFYMGREKRQTIMVQVLFLLGFISVSSSFLSAPNEIQNKTKQKEIKDVFSFQRTNNVLVILLEGFQSDYFDLIKNEYPDEIIFLDGFTFYRNTISRYPTSKPNMTAILRGRFLENQKNYNSSFHDSLTNWDIQDYYNKKGYNSKIVDVNSDNASIKDILKCFSVEISSPVKRFLDFGFFRCSPTRLKKIIYNDGKWLLSFKRTNDPPVMNDDDIRFVDLFEKQANIAKEPKAGTFKFIHFNISHPPLCVDENLKFNPTLKGKNGYIRQARGSMALIKKILTKLKELNIYDKTEIVIMADHGATDLPSLRPEPGPVSKIVSSSALALLLYKPTFANGKIVVDDRPLYNSDLGCLLQVENKNLDYAGFNAAKKGEDRLRKFLFYDWNNNLGSNQFPRMTEYIVSGHAYNGENWHLGRYMYTQEGKVETTSIYNYNIGIPVCFSAKGNANQYLLGGWSTPEPKHCWTDGNVAGLLFRLVKPLKSNLVLELKGFGYSVKGKIEHQNVNVMINGRKIASWKMKEDRWYNAVILKSMIVDGVNNILFEISDPAAPADFGQSKDRRKLGMAVRELVIKEEKNQTHK